MEKDERLVDYHNYDKLSLFVKNDKEENLIKIYKGLGYDLISSTPNDKYNNIVDLTFVRPHKIDNKDELQYLQVGIEIELNNIGKIEKEKHTKSIILSLTLGVIILFLLTFGTYKLLMPSLLVEKILSTIGIFIGLFLIILELIFLPKIIKKEKQNYEEKNLKYNKKLEEFFEKIKKLREMENEK